MKILLVSMVTLSFFLNACGNTKYHYQMQLDSDIKSCVKYYAKHGKFNPKNHFIALSWIGFFNGRAIYINQGNTYPEHFSEYPIGWAKIDSTLVLVYDSKYNNYFQDSTTLKREVDNVLKTIQLPSNDSLTIDEGLPLRFIKLGNTERIDTSRLNLKIMYK